MKPQSTKIKNDHALKKSVFSDQGSWSHLNPLSKKPTINKRNSLNSSIDHPQPNENKNVNYIKFEISPQTPHQRGLLNPEHQQNQGMQIERKVHEISLKVDRMQIELERNRSKINLLQSRKKEDGQIKKFITKIIEQQLSGIREKGENQIKQLSHIVSGIRKQIKGTPTKNDVQIYIRQIKQQIKGNFQLLEMQIDDIVKNYEITKEKQFKNIAKMIDEKLKILQSQLSSEKFNSQIWEKNTNSSQFTCSQKIFLGNPILLKFQNVFSVFSKQKSTEMEKNEAVYRIDLQGYLLDEENRYLVDENCKQIQLSTEQLCMLRDRGILK